MRTRADSSRRKPLKADTVRHNYDYESDFGWLENAGVRGLNIKVKLLVTCRLESGEEDQ